MLKKEHQILGLFIEKPWKSSTFKEIKSYAKKKSQSYIFTILKKFSKQGILKERKAGNVVLYSFNIDSEKAITYASIVAEHLGWGKKQLPHMEIERLMKRMPTSFFIMLVTGSYARNQQKKGS